MTEQKKQELNSLKVKFAQHLALLRQTFDDSPKAVTLSSWADEVQKQTAILDGLAVALQDVFRNELSSGKGESL